MLSQIKLFNRYLILIVTGSFISYWLLKRARKNPRKTVRLIPSKLGLPFVGIYPWLRNRRMEDYIQNLHNKHGKVVMTRLGMCPSVFVSDIRIIEHMQLADLFKGKSDFDDMDPMISMIYDNCSNEMKHMITLVTTETLPLIEATIFARFHFMQVGSKRRLNKLNLDFMIDEISSLAVSNYLLSRSYNDPELQLQVLMENVRQFISANLKIQSLKYFPFLKIFSLNIRAERLKYLKNTLENIDEVIDRREHIPLRNNERNLKDFIDYYIEAHPDYKSNDRLKLIIFEMLFRGIYPIAATLKWAFYYMVKFPAIQQSVQREIDRKVGRNRFVSLSDEHFLCYTRAVILEVQRMASIVPLCGPRKITEPCIVNNYNFPGNSNIFMNLYAMHKIENIWENPETFDPLRFIDFQSRLIIPKCFVPYGIGPQFCPGVILSDVIIFLTFSNMLQMLHLLPPKKGYGKTLPITENPYRVIKERLNNVIFKKNF